jgi:hypothetical protein
LEEDAIGNEKLCVNTKNGKFKYINTGNVANASGSTQKYKNNGDLADWFDLPFTKSLYKVTKTGKAKMKGSGQFAA